MNPTPRVPARLQAADPILVRLPPLLELLWHARRAAAAARSRDTATAG